MTWIRELLALFREYRQSGRDLRASLRAAGLSDREVRKLLRDLKR